MRRRAGVEHARRIGRQLVQQFGVSLPEHIDIEGFAARMGISIVVGTLDGANAQLVCGKDGAYILVSDRVTDPTLRRFSIAHELAHYILEHPTRPAAELCSPSPAPRGDSMRRDYEAEANALAAELLMPRHLVQPLCDVSPVDLDLVWRIADLFRVSCLAASIEVVRHSTEPCAAVFSKKGTVRWAAVSASFPYDIERGTKIRPKTEASNFYATGSVHGRPRLVPADAWLDGGDNVEIMEHAVASTEFETVLSMLWIPPTAHRRLVT